MKNKILICLLVLSMCLVLVGCGKKEEKENNINNETNTNQTNEDNNNTNNEENNVVDDNNNTNNNSSDDVIVDDDEILDIEDEDNTPPSVEKITVSEVINCNNCVYAYFSAEGENAHTLDEYVVKSTLMDRLKLCIDVIEEMIRE